MKFSEALEAYLDHRNTEPDESNGYTDKAWYNERQRLLDQLDDAVDFACAVISERTRVY